MQSFVATQVGWEAVMRKLATLLLLAATLLVSCEADGCGDLDLPRGASATHASVLGHP